MRLRSGLLVFNHISENVRDNLLGKSRHRLKDTALSKREKGILGRCVSNHDVIETNKRGSMHNHGLFQGSFSPETLAHLAEYPKLRELALKGLDTQLKAELPIEYHRLSIAYDVLKKLKVPKRRDAAVETPVPPEATGDAAADSENLKTWWKTFEEHVFMIVANRNIHEHRATCLEGLNGCTGCRMIYPRPHGIPESRLVELTRCIPCAPGSNEAPRIQCMPEGECVSGEGVPRRKYFNIRCAHCYADGAMQDDTLDDNKSEIRSGARICGGSCT